MQYFEVFIWIYAITVNIAGAAIAGADKRRAKLKQWRTPEKRFLLLAALGGGPGVLAGFYLFRHKTLHKGLIAGVAALTILVYGAAIAARFLLW